MPDIIHCSLKKDYQILIIFTKNIPDTTGHQMTIQFHILPKVCWGKQNKENNGYSRQYAYLIKITHIKHIWSRFLSLWLTVYPVVQLSNCLR